MSVGSDLRAGSEILGYRLDALLGRGGMGVVYRAYDARLKRDVALKLLSPELAADRRFRDRFLSETERAASLEHPNVIPIHDAGEVEGQLYLVMRLADGGDLKKLLAAEQTLEPRRAVAVCGQVAAALDAAHENGLVHRDVKPSNVLLDRRGHVYLADFGLSRRLSDQAPDFDAGLSLGTPAYVAPEQIEGKDIDGRADQYSLACLLHECLTGRPPFTRASEAAVLFAHLEEPPTAPPGLEELMAKGLAKDPAARYPTCTAFVEDARAALGIEEPRPRRRPFAVAAVALALVAAALLAYLVTRDPTAEGPTASGRLIQIDPASNEVVSTITVGDRPSAVAIGERDVWVADRDGGTVSRIDPASGAVALAASSHGKPVDVALEGSRAIVTNGPQDANVAVIAARTGSAENVITLATGGFFSGSAHVAAGESGVWLATGDRRVGRLDIHGANFIDPVHIAPPADERSDSYFSGIAVGDGEVWVVGDPLDRRLWRVDPRTTDVVASIPLAFAPKDVAVGEGAVWVTSQLDDTVSRVDPATNQVSATIEVGRGASGVAAGAGSIWVANSIDGSVSRIDPTTLALVETIPVEGHPADVAASDAAVWVTADARPTADAGDDEVLIGVLTACEGVFGFASDPSIAGAEMPLLARGGALAGPTPTSGVTGATVAGEEVRLAFGCGDQTGETVLAEARRLVEQVGVDVLIAPSYISEGFAVRDYARIRPDVTFVSASGPAQAPTLHDPAPNYYRFVVDGPQVMAGLGSYAFHDLGWRTAVTIAGDSAFEYGQVAGFTAEFCALGGTIVDRIWASGQDVRPYISEVPDGGVDGYVMAGAIGTTQAFVDGVPALRGPLAERIVGGVLSLNAEALATNADRYAGVVFSSSVPGFVGPRSARQKAWGRYVARFGEAFPDLALFGASIFPVSWTNAMEATLQALEAVDGDLSADQARFREALARIELDAPNGRLRLDGNRQVIAPIYLQQVRKTASGTGTLATFRTVRNVEQTFNGYFRPSDPILGRDTVACREGNPPRWASR